jgi:hypothetical protein
MTTIDVNDLILVKGKTYRQVFQWQDKPIVRKAIAGVSVATGAPVLNVPAHAMPDGWPCVVFGVEGMVQLNAGNNPPRKADYRRGLVLSVDHVELNEVNPYDERGRVWPAWTGGGFLQYLTPVSLAGYTARMSMKDKVGGTELFRFDTTGAPTSGVITVDDISKTITLSATDVQTAALAARRYVYDLEMVSALGAVTAISTGTVTVSTEVTTT